MAILDIYVDSHCPNCVEARRLADLLASLAPGLTVNLVALDGLDAQQAPPVFAAPTYLLDGRVVSLGNPTLEALVRHARAAMRTAGASEAGNSE